MNTTKLKAKVAAINRANREAMELYPKLIAIFAPLVGQKVFKQNGELLEKIKKLIPDMPSHIQRNHSDYNISWVVRAKEPDIYSNWIWHDAYLYIAGVRDGIIYETSNPPELRFNYNTDEVISNIEKADEAKKAYDDAVGKCWPFGDFLR